MTTIQLISNVPHGACSYYRTYGVFPKLEKIETLKQPKEINWNDMVESDILFVERPQDPNFLEICELAKSFGLKLWVDFDDNLFCLPSWNPGKPFFDDPVNQQCMIKAMQMSDVVTVATPAIKDALYQYNRNIHVIPNAFNDYNFDLDYNLSDNKTIIWRGSDTHRGDILPYARQIWDIAAEKKNNQWRWDFIGDNLWYITDDIPYKMTYPVMDNIRYFDKIKGINPAVYIVPLHFCEFNESKSNCGWLEMTYAGAVTLAPDMPEWKRPGITNYKDSKEFGEKLEILMHDPKLRKTNYKKSFDFIKCNLLLSKVNRKREEIARGLSK